MNASVFDSRISTLGEGPFWHPARNQLFWFDILGGTMHTRDAAGSKSWNFGEYASAAGWIDEELMLIATETGLWTFDLATGARERITELEADNPATRSNDGRADPWGGFWIGTMSKTHIDGAGAIYRFYRGELRKLFSGITIPNDICFAPDRSCAYFTDTMTRQVMKVALNAEDGWPSAEPEVFIDFNGDELNPDGAVVDAEGTIWIAQWGSSRVAAYDADGNLVKTVDLSVPQVTCPAFGGPDLTTLFVTTARENMDEKTIAQFPESGMVFHALDAGRGMPEYRVVI